MQRTLVIGARGHAKVVLDILHRIGDLEVVGVLDLHTPIGERVMGHPLLGRPADIAEVALRVHAEAYIVAIGDNETREIATTAVQVVAPELTLVTAVHPAATVGEGVSLGAGSVVMAGAVINPDCTIGRGCIVNTAASIDHDVVLEDYASVAPGAVLAGACHVGRASAIGLGASVVQLVRIGERTIVGAGALALRDIPARVVAFGVPATVVRTR